MYPDKIRLVYKNFPLDDNGPSMVAALAAMAAHWQGRFWEFHEALFMKSDQLNGDSYKEIAAELNLDVAKFEEDLEGAETLELVERDIAQGIDSDVDGVPIVFVNGRMVKNVSMDSVINLVEEELKNIKR